MPIKYTRLSKQKVKQLMQCFVADLGSHPNHSTHFGIKKRDGGSVYTQIIENASKAALSPVIKKLINKDDPVIYTDKFRTYDGLVFGWIQTLAHQLLKEIPKPQRGSHQRNRKLLEFCQTATGYVSVTESSAFLLPPQRV